MTLQILTILTAAIMVFAAVLTITLRDLVAAVVASSLLSLGSSLLFFILRAPDVAMTEAAIGVGLTTIVFLVAIRKTIRFEDTEE